MIQEFFEHPLATLSYYRFGTGPQKILCFHGYGMHGKQFKILEASLGKQYTFYGFDLFFHQQTRLKDQSLAAVKKGISKKQLADLIKDFCRHAGIENFMLLSYSMGTHYASAIAEELPEMINGFVAVAPAFINPGMVVKMGSKYKIGNYALQKLVLSKKALINMLKMLKKIGLLDQLGHDILLKEIETPELRFNFYACFTYLRFLETDEEKLISALNQQTQKPIFIFGKRDKMYPPKMGNAFLKKLKGAEVIILDENHEMINANFAKALQQALA